MPRCRASQVVRNDARRPRQAAVPVASARRWRASESLDDTLYRPRLPSYPAKRGNDLHGFLSPKFGMTHTGRSSSRGVAREASTRPSSSRGAMAIQPTGCSPSKAINPGAIGRSTSARIAARRRPFTAPSPGSARIAASSNLGYMHQQVAPQLPRNTRPSVSMRFAVKGRAVIALPALTSGLHT